jgi:hypothetical protein
MSRKLKFDLDIDASALLQANSEAFYSRAYLNEEVVDNYRTLPGVKYKTKISNVVFRTGIAGRKLLLGMLVN